MTMNKIDIRCPFCGATHSVFMDDASFLRWQAENLIQDAMPELSPTEREQLISGLCPKCQAGIFGSEEAPSDTDDC